jgi:tetratricopeptide (TPR) repeat protein
MGLVFAGFAVVLLLGGVGAFFMFSGDDNGGGGNGGPGPVVSGQSDSGTPQSGNSGSGSTSVTEKTPEPTPTPTKTLSPEEQAQRELDYGIDAFGRLDYKAAADYFKKYLEFKPDSEEAWTKLITCYERLRENDKLIEAIEAANKALGDKKELWEKLASIYTQAENYDKAFDAYDKYISLSAAGDKQGILEEVFFLAVTAGTQRQSKPYLDKGWAYLQQLKAMVDQETFDLYKENLKSAYGEIGQQAPF